MLTFSVLNRRANFKLYKLHWSKETLEDELIDITPNNITELVHKSTSPLAEIHEETPYARRMRINKYLRKVG